MESSPRSPHTQRGTQRSTGVSPHTQRDTQRSTGVSPHTQRSARASTRASTGASARASTGVAAGDTRASRCFGRVFAAVGCLQRASACVLLLLCCRKRGRGSQIAADNEWVDVGDRLERIKTLRHRRSEAFDEQIIRLHKRGLSRKQIYWRTLAMRVRYVRELFLDTLCGAAVDKMTGLPKAVLERYIFLSLEHTGPHGTVFKAHDSFEKPKPGRARRAYCIRVRDKSLGQVLQLPLRSAASVIRSEVIRRRGLLQRFMSCVGLAKARFKSNCFVEQCAIYQSSEFLVEVVEWCEGGSLIARLDQHLEQLNEHTACRIFSRVLMALQYLHDRNMLHRDIRLAQVMLPNTEDFQDAKVGDLWCVSRLPKGGAVVDLQAPFDYACAAPEVIREGRFSIKSDVWSAGCLLFELLHGHPPFGGHGQALVQRVLKGHPEFDEACNQCSENAADLINLLLTRSAVARPTAGEALAHPWFADHAMEKPERLARREPRRIRGVALAGRPPMCRSGLPAKNLLSSKAGALNGGFCTYMGLTSTNIDFEIFGRTPEEEYWVTSILVSLWGRGENPRTISAQVGAREGATYVDVAKHAVEAATETQVDLPVDRPVNRVRMLFRGNFGGNFGIALRKITFYGYQIRSVAVAADLRTCGFARGSAAHPHSESLTEAMVQSSVHASLIGKLEIGKRIQGTNTKLRKYSDIYSGDPHHSSLVQLPPLTPIPGVSIVAASWGLSYASSCPPRATPPRIKIFLVSSPEDGEPTRMRLFESEQLQPPEWDPSEILAQGYVDCPPMFVDGLDIDAAEHLHIEVQFENNAGYVHVPADFGLKLFYVPELPTPSESSASDGEDADAFKRSKQDTGPSHDAGSDSQMLGSEDALSEHPASEDFERELRLDMQELLKDARYGALGPADPLYDELPSWNPMREAPRARTPWWERGSQSSAADTLTSSSDDGGGGFGANSGSADEWGDKKGSLDSEELRAEEAHRREEQARVRQRAEALASERVAEARRQAEENAQARKMLRDRRAQAREETLREQERMMLQSFLPAACAGPLTAACSQLEAPLARCGFTPSPPPPSPRQPADGSGEGAGGAEGAEGAEVDVEQGSQGAPPGGPA